MTTPFKHGMYCPRCNRLTEHKIIKFGRRPFHKEMNGRKQICEECGLESSIIIGLPSPPQRPIEVKQLALTKRATSLALVLILILSFLPLGYSQEAPKNYWENNDIIVRGSIFTNNKATILYEVENKNLTTIHIKLDFNTEKFQVRNFLFNQETLEFSLLTYEKLTPVEVKGFTYFIIECPDIPEQQNYIGEKFTFKFIVTETESELRATLHIINYIRLETTLDVYKGWTFQTLLDAYIKAANEKTATEEAFSRYQLASVTAIASIIILCTLLGAAFGVWLKVRFLKRGLRR